jgi:hypothetical protein
LVPVLPRLHPHLRAYDPIRRLSETLILALLARKPNRGTLKANHDELRIHDRLLMLTVWALE